MVPAASQNTSQNDIAVSQSNLGGGLEQSREGLEEVGAQNEILVAYLHMERCIGFGIIILYVYDSYTVCIFIYIYYILYIIYYILYIIYIYMYMYCS